MKMLASLTREDLEDVVARIRARLFLDGTEWVRDKEVSGADFVEDVFNVLDEHGLAPDAD
jgi:hypothetical protein